VTTDGWLILAGVLLLLLAAVARGLALGRNQTRWGLPSVVCRMVAVAILAAGLVVSIWTRAGWSPNDPVQVSLALSLSVLVLHLLLLWRLGVDGASPVVDLLALFFLLLGWWMVQTEVPDLTCQQDVPVTYVQWSLYLFGMGGVMVAASASLLLFSRGLASRLGRAGRFPPESAMHIFLRHATAVGLVILGTGIVVGLWWAWRTTGSLYSGDLREIWMASTWLAAGTSFFAWQLRTGPAPRAAALSLIAAIGGYVGLWI
jgi:ABC-type transport system involved in cytochrome c biogenesis permease subunit